MGACMLHHSLQALYLEAWDEDKFTPDECIGVYELRLANCHRATEPFDQTQELRLPTNPLKPRGTLTFNLWFERVASTKKSKKAKKRRDTRSGFATQSFARRHRSPPSSRDLSTASAFSAGDESTETGGVSSSDDSSGSDSDDSSGSDSAGSSTGSGSSDSGRDSDEGPDQSPQPPEPSTPSSKEDASTPRTPMPLPEVIYTTVPDNPRPGEVLASRLGPTVVLADSSDSLSSAHDGEASPSVTHQVEQPPDTPDAQPDLGSSTGSMTLKQDLTVESGPSYSAMPSPMRSTGGVSQQSSLPSLGYMQRAYPEYRNQFFQGDDGTMASPGSPLKRSYYAPDDQWDSPETPERSPSFKGRPRGPTRVSDLWQIDETLDASGNVAAEAAVSPSTLNHDANDDDGAASDCLAMQVERRSATPGVAVHDPPAGMVEMVDRPGVYISASSVDDATPMSDSGHGTHSTQQDDDDDDPAGSPWVAEVHVVDSPPSPPTVATGQPSMDTGMVEVEHDDLTPMSRGSRPGLGDSAFSDSDVEGHSDNDPDTYDTGDPKVSFKMPGLRALLATDGLLPEPEGSTKGYLQPLDDYLTSGTRDRVEEHKWEQRLAAAANRHSRRMSGPLCRWQRRRWWRETHLALTVARLRAHRATSRAEDGGERKQGCPAERIGHRDAPRQSQYAIRYVHVHHAVVPPLVLFAHTVPLQRSTWSQHRRWPLLQQQARRKPRCHCPRGSCPTILPAAVPPVLEAAAVRGTRHHHHEAVGRVC